MQTTKYVHVLSVLKLIFVIRGRHMEVGIMIFTWIHMSVHILHKNRWSVYITQKQIVDGLFESLCAQCDTKE